MKGRKKKYQNPEEAKKVQKEKIRLWRLKNKDRIKLIVKEYHKKNPDIIEKSHKKYQTKNKDLILEKVRISNAKRLAEKKLSRTSYLKKEKKSKEELEKIHNENLKLLKISDKKKKELQLLKTKKKKKEYQKVYAKDNAKKFYQWRTNYFATTDKGRIIRLWNLVRKRIKTYTFSKVQTTRKDMHKLTGCSKLFLLKFIESKFYNHPVTNKKMTWVNAKDWHIDHITPLAVLDPKNEEHFKIANHFSNLQPMWADENLRKGANVTPGYGVAHLKRKYKKLQSLGDLTNISSKSEADKILKKLTLFLESL